MIYAILSQILFLLGNLPHLAIPRVDFFGVAPFCLRVEIHGVERNDYFTALEFRPASCHPKFRSQVRRRSSPANEVILSLFAAFGLPQDLRVPLG